MYRYFLKVVMARMTHLDQGKGKDGDKDKALPATNPFAEGGEHPPISRLHPGANRTISCDLLPFDEPEFYSRISPFAALLNAFCTLRHCYDARPCPVYKPVQGQTLANALEKSGIPDARAILTEFEAIATQISALRLAFQREPHSEQDRNWKGESGGDNGDILRDVGLNRIDFGRWTGNQDDKEGAEDSGGPQQGSSPSDASEMPPEDTILLLVPDESVGSNWSDSDTSPVYMTPQVACCLHNVLRTGVVLYLSSSYHLALR